MNDTTKENNEKNTYTNKVCHTLRLGLRKLENIKEI